jgi:predicted nucleotidyltransferase
VLKWPDAAEVLAALGAWADRQVQAGAVAVGYFGSYARGDWGVGSDLDLVVVVAHSEFPFVERASHYDASELPVPVDLLVYTQEEWDRLGQEGRRLIREVRWVVGR